MKRTVFEGIGTALITPFAGGKIDYKSLEGLIEGQIAAGVPALVIGGTTGEAATLDDEERYTLYRTSRDMVSKRAKIIFGTGTNDTRGAIRHTEVAEKIGCDGVLLVTPYYNKGTDEGLYRHYQAIAEETELPIILYNVPSRTGVNLSIDVIERLSEKPNIVGIKEASGSAERLAQLSSMELDLYAGNDAEIYAVLALGGKGAISVVSNLYPRETVEIVRLYQAGEKTEAKRLHAKLMPVIRSLFLETNPAPIKYALYKKGLCEVDMRLPMWLPTEATRKRIDEAIAVFEGKK